MFYNTTGNSGDYGGAVMIYKRSPGRYHQLGNTLMGDNTTDRFGHTVNLNANGYRVIVMSQLDDGDGNGTTEGSAKVFEFDENTNTWNQLGSTISGIGDITTEIQTSAGIRGNINADGTYIVVSEREAQGDDNGLQGPGLFRVFRYNNSDWQQVGATTYGEYGKDSDFGQTVEITNK